MQIIAHFDEIFLKGNNQGLFIKQLISNLGNLFVGVKVKRVESGLWLEDFNENELNRLALIPGIANFAPAFKVQSDMAVIAKAITDMEWGSEIKTFRIKCERTDKKFPLESMEIEKEIGRIEKRCFPPTLFAPHTESTIRKIPVCQTKFTLKMAN